jgi:multidrug resistance efflux pump
VKMGDTVLIVSRPDLSLDIDKKNNELERLQSQIIQSEQDYRSKEALMRIETEGKINRLSMDLAELGIKLSQQKSVSNKLKDVIGNGHVGSFSDSLMLMKASSISQEISEVKNYTTKEFERLAIRARDEKELIERDIQLINRELTSLKDEYNSLIKIAAFNGIVGIVDVQLDELVPPFKTILSIYELKPTLIKAFMNETISYPINPGDEVRIVSENRLYSIEGFVLELGARITDYPEKIQPMQGIRSYGQEVFIRISESNHFLNGEKVFVYPKELE